jgi:hypothetical protein
MGLFRYVSSSSSSPIILSLFWWGAVGFGGSIAICHFVVAPVLFHPVSSHSWWWFWVLGWWLWLLSSLPLVN